MHFIPTSIHSSYDLWVLAQKPNPVITELIRYSRRKRSISFHATHTHEFHAKQMVMPVQHLGTANSPNMGVQPYLPYLHLPPNDAHLIC